jgi:hypothetical protein
MRVVSLLFLIAVGCELLIEEIYESYEWVSKDGSGSTINHQQMLNPMIGYCCKEMDIQMLKVFTSPEIMLDVKPSEGAVTYQISGYRTKKTHDTSRAILMHLFVPCGEEAYSMEDFMRLVSDGASKVELLSILMLAALDQEVSWERFGEITSEVLSEIEQEEPQHMQACRKMLSDIREHFSKKDTSCYEDGHFDVAKFLDSKPFLVQIFLIMTLEDTTQLESFYDSVYQKMKDNGSGLDVYFRASALERGDEYTLYERIAHDHKLFYFKMAKYPPSYLEALEKRCEMHESHDNVNFASNKDTPILSLLCNLLYNPQTLEYSTEHLNSPNPNLRRFFQRHPRPFKVTDQIRAEWGEVLSSIDRSGILLRGDGERVSEADIDASILNVLRVLKRLCGLPFYPFQKLYGDEDERAAGVSSFEVFEEVVNEIWPFDRAVKVAVSDVVFEGFRNGAGNQVFEKNGSRTLHIPIGSGHVLEVMFSCAGGEKSFELVYSTCAENPLQNLFSVPSLTDFLIERRIRIMSKRGNSVEEIFANIKNSYENMYFVGEHDLEKYALKFLDSILPVRKADQHPRVLEAHTMLSKYLRSMESPLTPLFNKAETPESRGRVRNYQYTPASVVGVISESDCVNLLCCILERGLLQLGELDFKMAKAILDLLIKHNKDELAPFVEEHIINGSPSTRASRASVSTISGVSFPSNVLLEGFDISVRESNWEYFIRFLRKIDVEKIKREVNVSRIPPYQMKLEDLFSEVIEYAVSTPEEFLKLYDWLFLYYEYDNTNFLMYLIRSTYEKVGSIDVPCRYILESRLHEKNYDFTRDFFSFANAEGLKLDGRFLDEIEEYCRTAEERGEEDFYAELRESILECIENNRTLEKKGRKRAPGSGSASTRKKPRTKQ